MYDKYVRNGRDKVKVNVDKQKTFIEQRAYLETCIETLKEKFKKSKNGYK